MPGFRSLRVQGITSNECHNTKGLTDNLCKVLVFHKMKCACEMKKKKKERLYLSAVLPYVALAEVQQNGDNFYFIE